MIKGSVLSRDNLERVIYLNSILDKPICWFHKDNIEYILRYRKLKLKRLKSNDGRESYTSIIHWKRFLKLTRRNYKMAICRFHIEGPCYDYIKGRYHTTFKECGQTQPSILVNTDKHYIIVNKRLYGSDTVIN